MTENKINPAELRPIPNVEPDKTNESVQEIKQVQEQKQEPAVIGTVVNCEKLYVRKNPYFSKNNTVCIIKAGTEFII